MRKGDSRKAQILTVAERLFLTRGYLATTIDEILADVGCTKGSFYHHFDTKFAVLDAIAAQRAGRAFSAFQGSAAREGLARLNALLYHALPFGNAEQDFLAVILALGSTPEGMLVVRRLQAELRRVFLPELMDVLTTLRAQDLAGFGNLPVAELTWDASMAYCFSTLLGAQQDGAPDAERVLPLLNALRFLWERTLDLPYGSMEIITLAELTGSLAYAARKAALPQA